MEKRFGDIVFFEPDESKPTDETYSHEILGTVNVTLIKKAIEDGRIPYEEGTAPITEQTLAALAQVDVNPARVDALTIKDLMNPVLFIRDDRDGYDYLIDGAHRISRLVKEKSSVFFARLIKLEFVKPYFIRIGTLENGVFKEMPHKELATMNRGEFFQHNADGSHRTEEEIMIAAGKLLRGQQP